MRRNVAEILLRVSDVLASRCAGAVGARCRKSREVPDGAAKILCCSAGALVLALIGSLGAPRSLAATAVKMERIAAVHHLHVYTVTPGYAGASSSSINGRRGRPLWFLPKAITMPGYVFVPGRGILGEFMRPTDERVLQRVSRHPKGERNRPEPATIGQLKARQLESMPA